jgi:peptide/nickel transport system permease protein
MNYYVNRFGQAILTSLSVITIAFFVTKWMPGGPMDYLKATLVQQNPGMSRREVNALIANYASINPSEPLYVQYVQYVFNLLQGDFGQSSWYQKPVATIMADALPWTIFLMTLATFTTFLLGVALGATMAYKEGSWFDFGWSGLSMLFFSVPYYITALILVFGLGYQLQWFPTSGAYDTSIEPAFTLQFMKSVVYHLTLPYLSILLTNFGGWAIVMRSNSVSVLGEDYLRVARLRGLPDSRIALSYVGKNAILPLYTGLLIAIGFIFASSVVLEQIFGIPGMGFYLLQSMKARDDPLMMGAFIVITIAVVFALFVADLTYGMIDPRASKGDYE